MLFSGRRLGTAVASHRKENPRSSSPFLNPNRLAPNTVTPSQVSFLFADGAHDVHSHLALSGEPLLPDLEDTFNLRDPIPLAEYQDLTLQGLEYERAYSDYWNSTADVDGQVVDAVVMPVAPHAAVIPGKYYHTGRFTSCDRRRERR